jgi:CelD/BcsL family acetyltransferase involved in cellulose biosynthesis
VVVSTSTFTLGVPRVSPTGGVAGSATKLIEADAGLYHAEARIRDHNDLVQLKELLDGIAASDAGLTLFQSSDWIIAAADAVIAGHGAGEVRVLLGFEGTQPVAALPLSISGPALCRIAKSLGDPLAQYSDVLLREHSRGLKALAAAIRAVADVHAFLFRRVRDDSHFLPLLVNLSAQRISRSKAPFADLRRYADFQQFLSSQSKKSRERARLRRRAERQGTLTFEIAETPTRALQLTKRAIDLKRRWLRAQSIPSVTLTDDRWCNALLQVVSSFSTTSKPVISAIHLDGQPAAIEIGFVKGATYYAFLGAFDPRFKSWSPTKLAMEETIRWCFAAAIAIYDLLPPDDAYKAEWTNDAVGVADWLMAPTMRGEVAVKLVERCLRPAVKRIYSPIMRALQTLQGREAADANVSGS